jgi:hypothetical protein
MALGVALALIGAYSSSARTEAVLVAAFSATFLLGAG